MRQHLIRLCTRALPLAALLAAGCGLPQAVLPGLTPPTAKVTTRSVSGTVEVSFKGLAAYKTLATRHDIDRVRLTLSDERGRTQNRELSREELYQPTVTARFAKVSAGKAVLGVEAFDAEGASIGKGQGSAQVLAGRTVPLHATVAISAADTGNVQAIVHFVDEAEPACHGDFDGSDLDGDGFLSLDEFRATADVPAMPMVCPQPVEPVAEPPCPMPDPARQLFTKRDANGDQRLSREEFCFLTPVTTRVPRCIVVYPNRDRETER